MTLLIRCNFCTVDEHGRLTDRRAGRIPISRIRASWWSNSARSPSMALRFEVEPVQDYRFVVVFSGDRPGSERE